MDDLSGTVSYTHLYTDTPLDREAVGQAVYLNMISLSLIHI